MSPNRFARGVASTLVAGAAAGVLIAATPAPVARMASGVTFTYRMTSSAGQKQGGMGNSLMKVTMADGNARMEFQEGSANPMMKKGGYMLLQSKEQRMLIVDPKEKKAIALDAAGMGSGLGALADNPMVKMSFSDSKFSFTEQGAGETILGYRTRKVLITSAMTMNLRMMGMNQKMTIQTETLSWIASGLTALAGRETWEAWGKSFGSGLRQTNPELAKQMEQYQKAYGDGMALKQRSINTSTDGKGKVTVDTVMSEVIDLQKTSVDASMFELPAGYEVMDLRQMMAPLAAASDSLKKECAKLTEEERAKNPMCGGEMPSVGDQAKDGAKEGAKEALKQGIGGLFKKKKP
ncbi:MAG: DUF4412 domain-containing protein [Gemmatimonadaceae bacterium]|jgi:hypothetical protein|nr:DUF4412 domain-containing protein [Gemmatimonadaceae bacterium]